MTVSPLPSTFPLNENVMALPLMVPVTCCSPKICEAYLPVRVSPSCRKVTNGPLVLPPSSIVIAHMPATSAGLSCRAPAATEPAAARDGGQHGLFEPHCTAARARGAARRLPVFARLRQRRRRHATLAEREQIGAHGALARVALLRPLVQRAQYDAFERG